MYDKHVERVAIFSLGRRHEPPIVWVGQTGEQRLGQREDFELGVKFEFAPAATRGLYNGVNVLLIGPGRKPSQVCHVRLASGRLDPPLPFSQRVSRERATNTDLLARELA
jgi:hypothetical protein